MTELDPTAPQVVDPEPPHEPPPPSEPTPLPNDETTPLLAGELPPTVSVAPPQIAFYDDTGKLLLWYQGGVIDPPAGATYQAILPQGINNSETWYDVGANKLMKQTPLAVEVDLEGRKITKIPKGTQVFVNGELKEYKGGAINLDKSGPLSIALMNFRHNIKFIDIP